MELVGERYRPALGTAIQVAFSLGYMLQPVIAYQLRDEFWYQVAATSPNIIFPFIVMYVQFTSLPLLLSFIIYTCCLLFVVRFAVIRELFCPSAVPLECSCVWSCCWSVEVSTDWSCITARRWPLVLFCWMTFCCCGSDLSLLIAHIGLSQHLMWLALWQSKRFYIRSLFYDIQTVYYQGIDWNWENWRSYLRHAWLMGDHFLTYIGSPVGCQDAYYFYKLEVDHYRVWGC